MRNMIAIMGAMEDVELNLLKEKIQLTKTIAENQYTFYDGKLEGKDVVLVNTKIGTIHAAASTMLTILNYHPRMIVSQGVAGGHGNMVHQKDLIIGTEILNINSYFTPVKKEKEGIHFEEYQLVDFDDIHGDKVPLLKIQEDLIEKAKQIQYPYGKVWIGRIASRGYLE